MLYVLIWEHFNQDSLEHFTESYLMLFPTNTPHVHIHVLGITAIVLSPEILLLYQLPMNANRYLLQQIPSQWASSIKNSLAERKVAKETADSSNEGDSAFTIQVTGSHLLEYKDLRAWRIQLPPLQAPPLSSLGAVISAANIYTENPLLYHQSTFFKINFFLIVKTNQVSENTKTIQT